MANKLIQSKTDSKISIYRLTQRIKELQVECDTLRGQYRAERDKVVDLGTQVEELRGAITITPAEQAHLKEIGAQHRKMDEANNRVVEWLRLNRSNEIAGGVLGNLPLDAIVIMYMARGLELERKGVQ